MNRNLQAFFYTVLSGVLLAAGIPNLFLDFGSPLLGIVSLIPFYLALSKINSFGFASCLGAVQFGIVHLLSSFWLGNFKGFAIFTLGGTELLSIVGGLIFGQILYFPFNYYKKRRNSLLEYSGSISFGLPVRILLFASVWTIHEWYKSNGFLAYPWGTVIMTAYRWKSFTQIVSLTGTWGISFLFSLFAAIVAEGLLLYKKPEEKQITRIYGYMSIFCIILFCFSVLFGFCEYNKKRIPKKIMNTVIVQQNVDSWVSGNEMSSILLSQTLTDEAIEKANEKPDLVVWSEAVLSYAMPNSSIYYKKHPKERPLSTGIIQTNAPYIIGGPVAVDTKKNQFSNSAILFDTYGRFVDSYAKIQCVPFAEVLPYADIPWVQKALKKIAGISSGWTPGNKLVTFTIPIENGERVTFTTPICFEDAFPSVCRKLFLEGSEVFVNLTNDSWSLTTSAQYQHFVISSYRAQEFRTTLIRCTNSGYSVIVDPVGRILADLPMFTPDSLLYKVPIFEQELTMYALCGDWLPFLVTLSFFLFYIWFFFIELQNKKALSSECIATNFPKKDE